MTKFEWDLRKAQENLRKHRVSFEEAATAYWMGFRGRLRILTIRSAKTDS